MSYVESIGAAILSSKENTRIISRSPNFAPIVSKFGTKVGLVYILISVKIELYESNRSSITFLQKIFSSILTFWSTIIDVRKVINVFNIMIFDNSKFH